MAWVNHWRFATLSLQYYTERVRQFTAQRPSAILYFLLSCLLILWIWHTAPRHFLVPSSSRPRSPDPEKRTDGCSKFKASERVPGTWEPVNFKRPEALPYPDWDVQKTTPLPYRPFRNGPYHITMGLRAMKWNEWIELDNQFLKFHADKIRRIEERGPKCSKTTPEAYDGACELLEEL